MNDQTSSAMPSLYDQRLASLQGVPVVVKSAASTVRVVPTLGIGGSQTYIVQTYRHPEIGDYIFLQMIESEAAIQLALPPEIANVIARQRDALTAKSRSRGAKAAAADRKRRGIKPAFLKVAQHDRVVARRVPAAGPGY